MSRRDDRTAEDQLSQQPSSSPPLPAPRADRRVLEAIEDDEVREVLKSLRKLSSRRAKTA